MAGIHIREDGNGRYCLNDLHRAAGEEKRHGPSYWAALDKTDELVHEIQADTMMSVSALLSIKGGLGQGTWACKELAHSDFMKKVPEVLGEGAGNFSCTFNVPGPNGATRQSPGYRLPKREACLMAMSYSYELQAKVFDRRGVTCSLERYGARSRYFRPPSAQALFGRNHPFVG